MRTMKIDFSQIIPFLKGKVVITAHRNPDGDAVGSSLALYELVLTMGGEPWLYSQDPYGDEFKYLAHSSEVHSDIPTNIIFDATLVVDTGSAKLLGNHIPPKDRSGTVIVIDHHKTRDPFGDIEIVDSTASSAGVIIEELIRAANKPLSKNMAKALWCSIITDTGGFRYSTTDARTLQTGVNLLDGKADPWEAAQSLYESNPLERLQLLGLALNTIELRENGKVAGLNISRKAIEDSNLPLSLSSGFVNYGRSIKGVEVAFFIRPEIESPGKFRVSFRSRGKYPVDKVAGSLGGGGHANAAGCRLGADSMTKAMNMVFNAFSPLSDPK
jgi:bifunctional oligoribonuclease and PAP phosphatase NrnA